MSPLTMSEVTIESHRVAEEVVQRELRTAALEMRHVVHDILSKKLGSEHDEDHIWVKINKRDKDVIRQASQSTAVKIAYNILSYLIVSGIVYTAVTLGSR